MIGDPTVGRLIEPEIAVQCCDLLGRRHPRARRLEHDLRRIPRRELREDKGEETDAEEHRHRAEKTTYDIVPNSIHFHATSANDTP